MKITITRERLLEQLPQGDLPETLVLEGMPFAAKPDQHERKYEEVHKILSSTNWLIFKELIDGEKDSHAIAKYLRYGVGNRQNTIAVHVHAINKALRAADLPYCIMNPKRGVQHSGVTVYKLFTK